jgi:hypothetical protein
MLPFGAAPALCHGFAMQRLDSALRAPPGHSALATFACFLLFELQKHLRIHPAQYLLLGLALAAFFLLLLGLSEHLPFAAA